jgi:hypothetical protein
LKRHDTRKKHKEAMKAHFDAAVEAERMEENIRALGPEIEKQEQKYFDPTKTSGRTWKSDGTKLDALKREKSRYEAELAKLRRRIAAGPPPDPDLGGEGLCGGAGITQPLQTKPLPKPSDLEEENPNDFGLQYDQGDAGMGEEEDDNEDAGPDDNAGPIDGEVTDDEADADGIHLAIAAAEGPIAQPEPAPGPAPAPPAPKPRPPRIVRPPGGPKALPASPGYLKLYGGAPYTAY